MKILCPNLDMIDISCDDWDNTEEQCSFTSIVVPSKTE